MGRISEGLGRCKFFFHLNDKFSNSFCCENIVHQVSQSCKDMFISCSYGGFEYNCTDIFVTVLTDEGLCCTFNAVNRKFIAKPNIKSDNLWHEQQKILFVFFWFFMFIIWCAQVEILCSQVEISYIIRPICSVIAQQPQNHCYVKHSRILWFKQLKEPNLKNRRVTSGYNVPLCLVLFNQNIFHMCYTMLIRLNLKGSARVQHEPTFRSICQSMDTGNWIRKRWIEKP